MWLMVWKHLDVMNTDQSYFFGSLHRKLNWIMQAHITASNSKELLTTKFPLTIKPYEVTLQHSIICIQSLLDPQEGSVTAIIEQSKQT